MTRLERTKWTSVQPRQNFRHFEVCEVRGMGRDTFVTLNATLDRSVKITIPLAELLDTKHFRSGWQRLPLPDELN